MTISLLDTFRANGRLRGMAIFGLGLMGLASCAKPSTAYPVIPLAEVQAAMLIDQRANVTARLDRLERVNSIGWPLLVANADLCHNRRADRFGFSVGNDKTIRALADGFTLKQVNAIGYDASPVVLNVFEGTPAARAGLVRGAVPIKVGETDIGGEMDALNEALSEYSEARAEAKEKREAGESETVLPDLDVVFQNPDGSELRARLTPETICSIPLNVSETDSVNANTGGTSVNMFRGLLTLMEDDDDVAIVIGHEIGHVIGRHVPKQRRNTYVSGFALWGIPVVTAASLFDGFFAAPLERWGGIETPPGQAGVTRLVNGVLGVRSFEREADYIGMYVAARGGVDISTAEEVFAAFAKLSPSSTYGERTHPITADRQLALEATREEIEAKQAAGELLIPNDWPYPVLLDEEADASGEGE
ncbi:MAG: M48 family metallopeptidase [Hyphomonadaceae bacterium]